MYASVSLFPSPWLLLVSSELTSPTTPRATSEHTASSTAGGFLPHSGGSLLGGLLAEAQRVSAYLSSEKDAARATSSDSSLPPTAVSPPRPWTLTENPSGI